MTAKAGVLQRLGLRFYGRVPPRARQLAVRLVGPAFTVGTMTVVTRDDGAVLLVKLSYIDRWSVPGGLINRREEPTTGAIRETEEEAGVRVDLVGEPAVVIDPEFQVVRIIYRARLAAGVEPADARPTSAEILDVTWVPAEDVAGWVSDETADAYRALLRVEGQGAS